MRQLVPSPVLVRDWFSMILYEGAAAAAAAACAFYDYLSEYGNVPSTQ